MTGRINIRLDKRDMAFWLKKRGNYPFVTYRGGSMKAELNLQIPLDEIAKFYDVSEMEIGGERWESVKKQTKNSP